MSGDKILNCIECGLAFVFSEDEQKRHRQRGYGHEPRRCPPCRADARRRRKEMPPRGPAPGPGHVTACASCGVEVFQDHPPAPGSQALCDNCRG